MKAKLRELLNKQPRYPISLLPTPLVELPQFSVALGGPRIFMKRDDMTGLAYGGNKARKLDYFIGEAKAQGCDVFIGGGGAIQSNHALMCAAAARNDVRGRGAQGWYEARHLCPVWHQIL